MHTGEGDILGIDIEPERWRLDFPSEIDGHQGHGRRFKLCGILQELYVIQ